MRKKASKYFHEPVLVEEVLTALRVRELAHLKPQFIDATLGLGGHSIRLIEAGARILGIDADKGSLEIVEKRLKKALLRQGGDDQAPGKLGVLEPETKLLNLNSDIQGLFELAQGNFKDIDKIAHKHGFSRVDGILFDLGISSYQLGAIEKGFSFESDASLDMRLDPELQQVRARDLLNALDSTQLTKLFSVVLTRGESILLAKEIVHKRRIKAFETQKDLREVVKRSIRPKMKLNVMTLPLLSLRIAVNSELYNLKEVLPKALTLLRSGGRIVVISFHSAEDRIVKEFFKEMVEQKGGFSIYKKPIMPKKDEVWLNPRSRSAKMRVFQKN